jgi:F-type H+-transporting ATPase subunit epsilon
VADKFTLQIVTPEREFYKGEASMLVFNTSEGEIGVLKGHIPLTTILKSGEMIIKNDGQEKKAALHSGFAEITGEKVVIITDAAEWPEEIDKQRALEAKKRAEQALVESQISDVQMARIHASLSRALARITVAEHHEVN